MCGFILYIFGVCIYIYIYIRLRIHIGPGPDQKFNLTSKIWYTYERRMTCFALKINIQLQDIVPTTINIYICNFGIFITLKWFLKVRVNLFFLMWMVNDIIPLKIEFYIILLFALIFPLRKALQNSEIL